MRVFMRVVKTVAYMLLGASFTAIVAALTLLLWIEWQSLQGHNVFQ